MAGVGRSVRKKAAEWTLGQFQKILRRALCRYLHVKFCDPSSSSRVRSIIV